MSSKEDLFSKKEAKKQAAFLGTGLENGFPIEFIERNLIVTKNGRVAVAFALTKMMETETSSEHAYDTAHFSLVNALTFLPVGTIVHKMDVYADDHFYQEVDELDYFGKTARSHCNYRPILKHQSFLFIAFPGESDKEHHPANTFFALSKSIFPNPLRDIDVRMGKAEAGAAQFIAGLGMVADIALKRMENRDLLHFYHQYMNLNFLNQIDTLEKPIYNDKSACLVGDLKLQIVSMIGQGSEVATSVFNQNGVASPMIYPLLTDLYFPHIVNLCIKICDTTKELQRLDVSRTLLKAFSSNRDQAIELHETGLEALSEQIRVDKKELVKFYLNVMVFDRTAQGLQAKVDATVSSFRSIAGIRCFIENVDTTNLFFAMIGGNASENFRWLLMPAENAACYFHFSGKYESATEGFLLCDRKREPVYVNFWNDRLDNKNKLVVGPSGSGKSFTVNSFIIQHHQDGDDVCIIDVGGSYKRLSAILGGKYFEYHPDKPLAFNPFVFKLAQDALDIPKEKISFLVALLAVLWKKNEDDLQKTERAFLSHHIVEYYQTILGSDAKEKTSAVKPGLNSFFAYLEDALASGTYEKNKPYFDVQSLLIVLKDYTGNGAYAFLLNADEGIDIAENRLICFDMNGIKEDASVFPVVSMLIIELVLDKLRLFPLKRKHIYMDEAWSMLKDTLGEFVMNMYRTIRKSNGAITIITQGIDEIEKSPVGKAILQNAATKILLDHASATQFYPILQQAIGLTEHEMTLLKSIRKNDQQGWREFFVKFGNTAKILMLDVAKEMKVAFDSRIETRKALDGYLARYNNLELAINQLIEDDAL